MNNSFNIFGINITFYSICILIRVILAYFIITKQAKKEKIDNRFIDDIIFYGLLSGIVGARIYYVLFNLDYYLYNINE